MLPSFAAASWTAFRVQPLNDLPHRSPRHAGVTILRPLGRPAVNQLLIFRFLSSAARINCERGKEGTARYLRARNKSDELAPLVARITPDHGRERRSRW